MAPWSRSCGWAGSLLILSTACEDAFLHDLDDLRPPDLGASCPLGDLELEAVADSDGNVRASWTFEGDAQVFVVEKADDGSAFRPLVDDLEATEFVERGVRDQTPTYRVRPDNLTCPASNEVEVRAAPLAPVGLAAENLADGDEVAISLSWSDPNRLTDNCFRVSRMPSFDVDPGLRPEPELLEDPVAPETEYTYVIETVFPCVEPRLDSGAENAPSVTVVSLPAPVVDLAAPDVRPRSVRLTWTDPNQTTNGIVVRRFESDDPPGGEPTEVRLEADGSEWSDEAALPGTGYRYEVIADSPSGESAARAIEVETPRDPIVALGPPRLDDRCGLESEVSVQLDPRARAVTSTSGAIAIPTLEPLPAPVSTSTGIRFELPDGRLDLDGLRADGRFELTWSVTDDLGGVGEATTEGRMAVGDEEVVSPTDLRPSGAFGVATLAGQQPLYDDGGVGCRDCRGLAGSLSMGTTNVCALLRQAPDETRVGCWGTNDRGQLGIGSESSSSGNPRLVCDGSGTEPSPGCPLLDDAVQVSTGQRYFCVLRESGEVWCAGENQFGSLGRGFYDDGSEGSFSEPFIGPVCETGRADQGTCVPLSNVEWVNAGRGAIACAGLRSGEVVCWGSPLGRPNPVEPCATGDTLLGGACPPLAGIVSVGMGNEIVCFVLSDGTARCLGFNGFGQLGAGVVDPDNDQWNAEAQTVCTSGSGPTCVPLDDIVAIGGGRRHMCALRGSGEVWCWGRNHLGQLGNGDLVIERSEHPLPVCRRGTAGGCDPLTDAVAIELGQTFSCALTEDGTVECWGSRGGPEDPSAFFNPLGDGLPSDFGGRAFAAPVCEVGALGTCQALGASQAGRMVALTAGQSSACALSETGQVWCWGGQSFGPGVTTGALGHGSTYGNASNPVPVCLAGEGDGRCSSQTLNSAVHRRCTPLSLQP